MTNSSCLATNESEEPDTNDVSSSVLYPCVLMVPVTPEILSFQTGTRTKCSLVLVMTQSALSLSLHEMLSHANVLKY